VSAVIGRASDRYGPGVSFSIVGDRVFGAALAGKPALRISAWVGDVGVGVLIRW
jgi:hypothetical protein